MSNWFYQLEGLEPEGPISTTRLKELANDGSLKPTDLIWKEGYKSWVKAKRLQGLFPSSNETLPLPTPFPPIPPPRLPNPPELDKINIGKINNAREVEEFLLSDNSSYNNLPSIPITNKVGQNRFEPTNQIGIDQINLPHSVELRTFSKSDVEASAEWRNRKIPGQNGLGIFGKMFSKSIKEFNFSDKVKLKKVSDSNELIEQDDVLEQLKSLFQKRDFCVRMFDTAIIVTKRNTNKPNEKLPNVYFQSNSFIKIKENPDKSKWILDINGEGYFWTKATEQVLASGFFFIIFLIFFWPCICFLPLMFQCPEEEVIKNHIQSEIKEIVEKINAEFI